MRLHAAVLVAGAHHGHAERRGRHGGAGKSPAPSPRLRNPLGPGRGSHKMAAGARRRAVPGRVTRAAPPRRGQPRSGRQEAEAAAYHREREAGRRRRR